MPYLHELKEGALGACGEAGPGAAGAAPPNTDPPWGAAEPKAPKPPPVLAFWATDPNVAPPIIKNEDMVTRDGYQIMHELKILYSQSQSKWSHNHIWNPLHALMIIQGLGLQNQWRFQIFYQITFPDQFLYAWLRELHAWNFQIFKKRLHIWIFSLVKPSVHEV